MFSKTCEYGIRSLIYITQQSIKGRRVNISKIAKAIDSPTAFTAKILQTLVKSGILSSSKGPKGGFCVSDAVLKSTTLADVVRAIDGDKIFIGCGMGLSICDEIHPCPLHKHFKSVRNELKKLLVNTSINELALQLDSGGTTLKIEHNL